ncbi:MAG: hypothetical protein ACLP50_34035 [Solirubrobacteraceae bacterium]
MEDELFEVDDEPVIEDAPDFRVAIRRSGVVRLVDWTPWLAASGTLYVLFDGRGRAGVAIADLTVLRNHAGVATEVIVDFRCGGSRWHRDVLCGWAASVGYRRAWFDEAVVELEPAPGGTARARCSGCGALLADNGAAFWDFVRHRGAFPTACVLCGSDLPQWSPAQETIGPGRDQSLTGSQSSTQCK